MKNEKARAYQMKYAAEYNKKNYKPIGIRLNYQSDADVIDKLSQIKAGGGSMNEYIIGLIRADISK